MSHRSCNSLQTTHAIKFDPIQLERTFVLITTYDGSTRLCPTYKYVIKRATVWKLHLLPSYMYELWHVSTVVGVATSLIMFCTPFSPHGSAVLEFGLYTVAQFWHTTAPFAWNIATNNGRDTILNYSTKIVCFKLVKCPRCGYKLCKFLLVAFAKVQVWAFESHSYLPGLAADELRRQLRIRTCYLTGNKRFGHSEKLRK